MIILNEIEYAQNILKQNVIYDNIRTYINILTRYFIQKENLSKKDTYLKIDNFLKSHYKKYNYSKWQDYINKQIDLGKKYPLSEIDNIPITSNELEAIEKIKNLRLEKLAFTLLCLAKFSNLRNDKNSNWVNKSITDIFRMAHINVKSDDKFLLINDLLDKDLINYNKKIDNTNICVKFIDDQSDIVLRISDFRELGYEYLLYKGESYFRCNECGILSKQNKLNNKRYCNHCSKYQPIETKTIQCIDCGKDVEIDSKDNQTIRCDECRQKHQQYIKSLQNKRYYDKNKIK
jgi:DNA-directed RNA polymerase subunit RPC12/RpoP